MPENQLVFGRIREALISSFPELWERIEKTFGSYYDLEEETPEAYPIFEDVVQKLMFELLQDDSNQALLGRLFRFFEDMANSPDPNVSRDLLGIAILEPLVYKQESIRRAWKYMGPRTRNLAMVEARSQGRLGNLPIESEDLKL
jgi:hypothetical protein